MVAVSLGKIFRRSACLACKALLLVVMVLGPLPAHAAGRLVAAVLGSDLSRYKEAHRAFIRTLAQKGYDQSNLEIIVQSPNPDTISWANSIRKVTAIGADIIVTYGAPLTLVAIGEADETPIVFVDVYDPVETGIAKSMTIAGRNLTGVSSKVPMITLIKIAAKIKPVRTMGVIYNSREVGSVVQLKEIKRLAAQQGFAVVEANVSTGTGLDMALNAMLPRVDYLYVSECVAGSRGFERIVRRANEQKIPVISQMPEAAVKGALVALEVSPVEQGQLAGEDVVRILGGKRAAQIPIATPRKIELIVNMRAAKSLALHVPFHVLSAATKIIK